MRRWLACLALCCAGGAQAAPLRVRVEVDAETAGGVLVSPAPKEAPKPKPKVEPEAEPERDGRLEELVATTTVALSGERVTHLSLQAAPGADGTVTIVLPPGASLWKAMLGRRPIEPAARAGRIALALPGAGRLELVVTGQGAPLGIRGRARAELPGFTRPVRGVSWAVFLPDGLVVEAPQASLPSAPACEAPPKGRLQLEPAGRCHGFSAAVLPSSGAWVEAPYGQRW